MPPRKSADKKKNAYAGAWFQHLQKHGMLPDLGASGSSPSSSQAFGVDQSSALADAYNSIHQSYHKSKNSLDQIETQPQHTSISPTPPLSPPSLPAPVPSSSPPPLTTSLSPRSSVPIQPEPPPLLPHFGKVPFRSLSEAAEWCKGKGKRRATEELTEESSFSLDSGQNQGKTQRAQSEGSPRKMIKQGETPELDLGGSDPLAASLEDFLELFFTVYDTSQQDLQYAYTSPSTFICISQSPAGSSSPRKIKHKDVTGPSSTILETFLECMNPGEQHIDICPQSGEDVNMGYQVVKLGKEERVRVRCYTGLRVLRQTQVGEVKVKVEEEERKTESLVEKEEFVPVGRCEQEFELVRGEKEKQSSQYGGIQWPFKILHHQITFIL